jgi:hypothetical protein
MASPRPSAPSSSGAHPHRCRRPTPLRDALWQPERHRACGPVRRQAELGIERLRRVPGIVNSGSPAASSIQWQPGTSATAWLSCAPLSWSTGIRRGSSSGAGPRRARRNPQRTARRTCGVNRHTRGVHVAQAVALPPGCHPGRRAVTETRGLSCRGRAGGTTFPASARLPGITTRCPAEVRTAKESASFSSRMPRRPAICSPPSGLRRRQRITPAGRHRRG